MKTSAIVASTIAAVLLIGVGAIAYAHPGVGLPGLNLGSGLNANATHRGSQSTLHSSANSTDDQNEQGNQTQSNDDGNETGDGEGHFNLTAGTTLTFSNLTGIWVGFSHTGNDSGDDEVNDNQTAGSTNSGNSTGSFTFKVSNSTSDGLVLTIVSGSFSINGTTYTVSGGNVTLNEGDESAFGQGTASGGATFDIHIAGIHGNATSAALVGAIKLDVKVGTSDFLVILGNSQGVEEDSQD